MARIMSMQELFYGEREAPAYKYVHYEHMFSLMEPMRESVVGPEPAQVFGSRGSYSCNEGARRTRISRRVQERNRDQRSFVDTRDSQRYARTCCHAYAGSAANTHYVSVNPTVATRVESRMAWLN